MHWVIIGDKGLFGSELANFLESLGENPQRLNRATLDLGKSAEDILKTIRCADVLVNTVGFTKVDQAEQDANSANMVNGIYAGKLAEVAARLGAKYFYISSDYIFDGRTTAPYSISDVANPQNVYGQSKLLGEQLISNSGANYTIFRTSWLYGSNGKNFAKTIFTKLLQDNFARVVCDQFGSPTWTRDLAEVVFQHGIHNFAERIVHSVASNHTNWFDFSVEIAKALPAATKYSLTPASTAEFATLAKRPAFSVLDNSETQGPIIGDWRERWRIAAPEVLAEFLAK